MTSPGSGPAPGAGGSGALLVRGGHVLTMDPAAGDLPGGDVLVSGGTIAAVGAGLAAPAGASVIDAAGMIVAPGLVDTHWHMWNTLLRGMSEGGPGYFRVCRGLGPAFGPGDVAQGTLLACAEAISSGITTVHDWAHNVRGPEYAEAGLGALARAGLRARFSYGYPAAHRNDQPMDLAALRLLHADWDGRAAGGLLSLGMACRGPGGSDPAMHVPAGVYRPEFDTARELGIPVTIHACGPPHAAGQIGALAREGLLGPDVQVVHANCATAAEIGQLAAAGATVSISPFSELLIGYGMPRTAELLAAGIPVGLSADTTVLTGNADMFAIMKVTQGLANGLARDEFALTARRTLALATIEGARCLGLAGVTGSLTPGKRADLIVVSPAEPNLGVLTDPAQLLVTAAQPGNVDTVIADGRVLKDGGVLTTLDAGRIGRDARQALAGVLTRSRPARQ
ncbi:MAG TPA: amidohydrolase family protein [Streptosporangiaceae bacterium]|nr:amidohydrolase family protein [Streptosporangiaceae bacterium]